MIWHWNICTAQPRKVIIHDVGKPNVATPPHCWNKHHTPRHCRCGSRSDRSSDRHEHGGCIQIRCWRGRRGAAGAGGGGTTLAIGVAAAASTVYDDGTVTFLL